MGTVERLPPSQRPSPEEYGDYRRYLADLVAFLKAHQRRFTNRHFAKIAGFSSPAFLTLVIQGKRNLTQSSIARFARGLGLSLRERETFEALVLFGQAKTDEERNHYYAQLRRYGSPKKQEELSNSQYEAHTRWYVLPIREMMSLPEFREDPKWIAERLYPAVTVREVEQALDILLRTGLVERDSSGKLVPVDPKLSAIENIQSLAVRNYHRSMLKLAARTLDQLPRSQRNVTSVTTAMTQSQYEAVCGQVDAFRRQLLDTIDDAPKDDQPRKVFVMGFQVFPVTTAEASDA